ncbi:MAG: hypothetical protein EOP06_12580 [Proteobacteria bacterium]|nr:MAG: hypothetical protein EOP06_12580 [Pseudomonadota bacterium]
MFASFAFVSAAQADVNCEGLVKKVSMEATTGDIFAESIGELTWPRLCSINTVANGIQPNVCKSIYSTLLAAQVTGRTVTVSINRGDSCRTVGNWAFVQGFYFLRSN